MTVSRLTSYRGMRPETLVTQTGKSLTSVSRESHETNCETHEGKRPTLARSEQNEGASH
jgi:hypothetical protein